MELMTITPELAKQLLSLNTSANRAVRKAKVDSYAKDMISGLWRLTHQGIAFDWHGNLVDGQHRLHAILKSGVTLQVYAYRGLNPDHFAVLDTGAARSAGDFLKKMSFTYPGTVGAAARLVLRYGKAQVSQGTSSKSSSISNSQIEVFCKKHYEEIGEASYIAVSAYNRFCGLRKSGTAAFLMLASEVNIETYHAACEFIEMVASGANLAKGSVPLAFRNYLSVNNIRTHNLNSTDFSLAVLIKAWNKHVNGSTIMLFKPGNLTPFPSVQPA
jgi:hypothetical protein